MGLIIDGGCRRTDLKLGRNVVTCRLHGAHVTCVHTSIRSPMPRSPGFSLVVRVYIRFSSSRIQKIDLSQYSSANVKPCMAEDGPTRNPLLRSRTGELFLRLRSTHRSLINLSATISSRIKRVCTSGLWTEDKLSSVQTRFRRIIKQKAVPFGRRSGWQYPPENYITSGF